MRESQSVTSLMPEFSNQGAKSAGPEPFTGQPDGIPLQIRTVTAWNELEAIRPPWDRILRSSETLTIFSTFEWLGAWWETFGKEKELVAPVFLNSKNDVLGVVPLYADRVKAAHVFHVRRLRFVGDGSEDSDNLDLVIQPGYENSCIQAFLSWLDSNSHWDICELNTLPLDSAALLALVSELKSRRWIVTRLERPRSTISLPDTWEGYLKQTISKKEKTKISYYTNRLQKRFQVSMTVCEDARELPTSLDALFDLHQRRWQSRGGPGTFASAERRHFYQVMAAFFLARGWLGFWILRLDGKPVAAQFGFRYRDAFYSLQEGFDPAFSADRVGYLLRAHALKTLIGQGVRQYDFLGGEDPSKDRWGAKVGTYADIHFARPHTRGSTYLTVDEAARKSKNWLRSNLPTPVVDAIREAKRDVSQRVTESEPNKQEEPQS